MSRSGMPAANLCFVFVYIFLYVVPHEASCNIYVAIRLLNRFFPTPKIKARISIKNRIQLKMCFIEIQRKCYFFVRRVFVSLPVFNKFSSGALM